MPTWSGSIQCTESGKDVERLAVDDGDVVAGQIPVKAQYELAW
jgi:hypothetical protein